MVGSSCQAEVDGKVKLQHTADGRVCGRCGLLKPFSEYYKKVDKKKGWEGYHYTCRSCAYSYQLERDPYHNLRAALGTRKRDAVKNGIPFDITLEDLLPVPTHCPALGIPLSVGKAGGSDYSVSIDRLIPAVGYVKGNVVLMSLRANRIKNDATPAELRQIASFIEELTK